MQIIFHIDLNAFYASAEMANDSSLEGKPLVISGNNRRAIVSTASYEARKYGIHSAMPLFQAKQLCKNLIIKPVNFDLYRRLSSQFFELISTYSPLLEIASIDECYVDFSNYIIEHNIHPYKLAKIIQNDVLNTLKLKCSIGIAPNKFMAKMASDMKKPMGITILNKSNYKQLLWPLDVSEMFGIGKKTAPKLKEMGILTGGVDFKDLKITLAQAVGETPAVTLNYGVFIQNVFDFIIIAFAIFMMIKGINKVKKPVEEVKGPSQEELLTEIRDLLKKQ